MAYRILVVDQHAAFTRVTLQILKHRGGEEVVTASTSQTGGRVLQKARQFRPDLILVDLSGPDLLGLAHILHLRRELPKAKIIAATMLTVDTYRDAVMAAGANDLIFKGSFSTELMPAILRQVGSDRSHMEHRL